MGGSQIEREIRRSKKAYESMEIPGELADRVNRALTAGNARLAGEETRSGGYESRTAGYEGRAGGYESRAGGYEGRAGGYEGRAGGYEGRAGGYESRTAGDKCRPARYGSQADGAAGRIAGNGNRTSGPVRRLPAHLRSARRPPAPLRTGRPPAHLRSGWVTAAAAALVLACFTAGLNTSQAFAAAAARVPVIGAVSRVLTFRTYDSADQDMAIHMEIPRIQAADGAGEGDVSGAKDETAVSEGPSATTAEVNRQIERLMDQYRAGAEAHIAEYKEAFLATGGTEEEFAQKGIKVDAGYEVKYESGDTLSLMITANENWTNAYGVRYIYNLDLATGREITLEDLLGPDYRAIADQSIRRQMKERMAADSSLVYWDGSDGITGYEGVDENTQFYLNAGGIPVVLFEKYQIAPGAFGAQEFEIRR